MNSWQAWCWDAPKYPRGIDPFSLKSNLESPPYLASSFYTHLNWCEYHHSKSQMSLPCCHMVSWWRHNLFQVGMLAHVPGHLSRGHHSEQNAKTAALLIPLPREKMPPQVHTVTYMLYGQITWNAFMEEVYKCICCTLTDQHWPCHQECCADMPVLMTVLT